jgi:hypothetical protein
MDDASPEQPPRRSCPPRSRASRRNAGGRTADGQGGPPSPNTRGSAGQQRNLMATPFCPYKLATSRAARMPTDKATVLPCLVAVLGPNEQCVRGIGRPTRGVCPRFKKRCSVLARSQRDVPAPIARGRRMPARVGAGQPERRRAGPGRAAPHLPKPSRLTPGQRHAHRCKLLARGRAR